MLKFRLDECFNREFIINKNNVNTLTPYLVHTVETMIREKAFDDRI